MGNLAVVPSHVGKYKEAEGIHRRTLHLNQTVLAKQHPDSLTSMNNLARVLSRQDKYKEAEEIHWRTLQLPETVIGNEAPETPTIGYSTTN